MAGRTGISLGLSKVKFRSKTGLKKPKMFKMKSSNFKGSKGSKSFKGGKAGSISPSIGAFGKMMREY